MRKNTKELIKRIIILILAIFLTLTSGCAAFYITMPRVQSFFRYPILTLTEMIHDKTNTTEVMPSPEPVPSIEEAETRSILEYYESIRFNIEYRQYLELFDIYRKYGIEISMNEPWDANIAYTRSDIDFEQFGKIIDNMYDALYLMDEFQEATQDINSYINAISFFTEISADGKKISWLPSSNAEGYFLIDYDSASTSQELVARLLSIIAYTAIDESALKSYGFSNNNKNGFIHYNDQLTSEELPYIEYLAQYDITDPENILIECQKAGFLAVDSIDSSRADLAEYVYQSISPNHSLWWAYGYVDPIQTKTEDALCALSEINSSWSGFYIKYYFHPEYNDILLNNFSGINDTYFIAGGEYKGTYENTAGTMNAVLTIETAEDWTGEITARFTFGPGEGNTTEKSGEYLMRGHVDFDTNTLILRGEEWLSKQPEGYNMLDIDGVLFATKLVGRFNRNYLTEIELNRVPDSFLEITAE